MALRVEKRYIVRKPGVAVLTKIPVSGAEKPMSGIVRAVFDKLADEQNTGILIFADGAYPSCRESD